jgi:CHAT domain-containing protein/tetratricopeptide (TPR) repeat protein
MNRFVLLLIVSILAFSPVVAQKPTEAELSNKMAQAEMLRRANNHAKALDYYLWIGENAEIGSNNHVAAYFAASTCYFSLKQYRESYEMVKSILYCEDDRYRSLIVDQYVKCGYYYAKSVISNISKGKVSYSSMREVLEGILPYAKSADRPRIMSLIAYDWFFEGFEYHCCTAYEEALECYKIALSINEEIGMVDQQLNIIDKIARIYSSLGQSHEAIKCFERAEVLAQQVDDDFRLISIYTQLYDLYAGFEDSAKVTHYVKQIDRVGAQTNNPTALRVFYEFKGDRASDESRYKLAEQWYLRGVDLAQQYPNAVDESLFYFNLGNVYMNMGDDIDKALDFYILSLGNSTSISRDNHRTYLHIAHLYLTKGDIEACKSCIDILFSIEDVLSEPRERYALYNTRAQYYLKLKEYELALADYKFADELLSEVVSQTNDERVILALSIANVEYYLGNHEVSESYYERYLNGVKAIYGDDLLAYVEAKIRIAHIQGLMGKVELGCQNYSQATDRLRDIIKEGVRFMTTAERESFWAPLSELNLDMTPFAIAANHFDTEFTRSCYDALLLSKAFLLDSERTLNDVVQRYGDACDKDDYAEITRLKSQIKEWENDYIANASAILEATNRVDQLERELIVKMSNVGNLTSFVDVDYNAVKAALKPDEVLIDFTDYMPSSGRRYAAYIVNGTQTNPLLKELFAESEIEALGITTPVMYYMTEGTHNYASEVVKLLWDRLKESIGEARTIYYVPSQLLFQVCLESLPLEDGTLLGDHYNFVRLSSARELVKRASSTPRKALTATLYGGLEYDVDAAKMAKNSTQYDLARLGTTRGEGTVRGSRDFDPLPGSMVEVKSVSKILKGSGIKAKLYTGANGTEESFLNLHCQSPEILHIATHGFFYTPSQVEDVKYLSGYSDAMLLSGLIMSGGNAAWRGDKIPSGVLGGVLTANDIAKLDLSNTDLVVLSACKSGRGDVTSEGLYGLQRAFKKAGVNTLIMTLWSVDDTVTQEFMVTFYNSLVTNNWNKHEAFKAAKKKIRDTYPDPYHWAAFVMLD